MVSKFLNIRHIVVDLTDIMDTVHDRYTGNHGEIIGTKYVAIRFTLAYVITDYTVNADGSIQESY